MAEQAETILFDQIAQQMKRRNRVRKTLNIDKHSYDPAKPF